MKRFNSVQEVWAHCAFCPLCQQIIRDVDVIVGPHEVAELLSFKKNGPTLEINCNVALGKRRYKISFYIDCPRNTFTLNMLDLGVQDPPVDKASANHFFVTFMSSCPECNNTYSNSEDLELDLLKKTVSNIGISLEGIYLLDTKSKYHLTLQHETNTMLVSKMIEDSNGDLVDDNKTISFPITHFDFSKPKKVVNRLKTLLVFS